ncbi:hypothetical protein NBRC116493_35860 [Aurantivibrio infirmus]
MARLPRLYAPGCAQHIMWRGNNCHECFFDTDDYAVYLDKPKEFSENLDFSIHALVLMANHVHLLVTLGDEFSADEYG